MADRATVFCSEQVNGHLRLADLTQTADGAADGSSSSGVEGPRATSNRLVAGVAVPDTHSLALHGVLAAERASVAAVLGDFNLLDLATERRTVTRAVLAGDSNLDRALRLTS